MLKHRPLSPLQAWVVFADIVAATNALRGMQGFPVFDKPIVSQGGSKTAAPHCLHPPALSGSARCALRGAMP